MAIYVWDGFDHYNNTSDFRARVGALNWGGSGNISFQTPGRNGLGKALVIPSTNIATVRAVLQQRLANQFMGAAINCVTGCGVTLSFLDTTASNTVQCSVYFNVTNHSVQIWRGSPGTGTLLAQTGNNVWANNVYNFIECWPIIDSTSGRVRVYLNSVLLLDTGAGGVNTKQSANAWWDACQMDQSNGGTLLSIVVDDFYSGDTTTGAGAHPCNTPLGDCGTITLFATGNSSVTWTPLSGTNYQMIDEVAMDSDTSYNSTSTPGNEDLFTFGALSGSIVLIYGVQITGAYRKDDVGARSMKQALKSNVTEVYGSVFSLPDTSYSYITDQFILDPDTGLNWTVSGVNNVLAGYNLVS